MPWLDKFFQRGYTTIEVNGAAIAEQEILNLVSGFVATDDPSNSRTNLTVPDATGSLKGLVQLVNDFGGSASSPTVKQITGDGTGLVTLLATKEVWGAGNSLVKSYLFGASTASTSANQTIATIPVAGSSGVNQLDIVVVARQGANAYKTAIDTTYLDNGSGPVIMGSDSVDPNPKTAGTVGTPALNTLASSPNVLVRATPWTSTATTWTVVVTQTIGT